VSGKRKTGCRGKQIRRANLMKIDPHCWYCGMELVFVETDGGKLPDNYPTIEHLFSRYSGRIHTNHTNEVRRVLACKECNTSRQRWDDALLVAGVTLRRF
jgi:5-methylcytosine-specific restriction endonuclease McrA